MKLLLILFFFSSAPAEEKGPPVYVNKLSIEAAAVMRRLAEKDPKKLKSEAELLEWARARLAWIALSRLQGNESEALKIFEGCGTYCEKYGPEQEWVAQKKWACQKKREANPCLSPANKTKAQKPPRL